jgi:hypothetical protein
MASLPRDAEGRIIFDQLDDCECRYFDPKHVIKAAVKQLKKYGKRK